MLELSYLKAHGIIEPIRVEMNGMHERLGVGMVSSTLLSGPSFFLFSDIISLQVIDSMLLIYAPTRRR
jgi:hypothetical protein